MSLARELEYWRRLARFDLPERQLTDKERAARAQYEAIAEKLESPTPQHH